MVGVVCCFELQIHQVHCSKGRSQEENFHYCVVQRNKVGKQIQISCGEDHGKQNLGTTYKNIMNLCSIFENIGNTKNQNKVIVIFFIVFSFCYVISTKNMNVRVTKILNQKMPRLDFV